MACNAAISENGAKAFYDRLLATQGADGCTLEEVATEGTQMTVEWKSHGSALPVAEVVSKDCAAADALTTVGPSLAMHVPEPLRAACPATVQAAITVVQRESFDIHSILLPTQAGWRPFATGGLAVLVATTLFTIAMVLRHRAPVAPPSG
ncbi:MAG TPA: hypothetical protein VGL81_25290 [Polyangiaceae bacterium]|jgi:hypothetical protein